MPARGNLSGQNFKFFKVGSFSHIHHGRMYWNCICRRCGNETTVSTTDLRNEYKESCGCLKLEKTRGSLTEKRAQNEQDANRRIQDNKGRWWLASRAAVEYVGFSDTTLRKWEAPHGKCPWLDGAALEVRIMPGAFNKPMTYYAEDGLNKVLEAKARPMIPQVPGFVHVMDAAEQLNFAFAQTVGKNRRKRKGRFKRVHGRSKDGRALPRDDVRQTFLERELKAREATIPSDRMTVGELAEKLHIKPQSVHNYLRDGRLPYIVKDGPTKKEGFHRPIVLIDRRAAEKMIAERNGETVEPGSRMKHGTAKDALHTDDPHGIGFHMLRVVQPMTEIIRKEINGVPGKTVEELRKNPSPMPAYMVPNPNRQVGSPGAPEKYPGVKLFVEELRKRSPKITWKDVYKKCGQKFDADNMPADSDALKDYCRPPRNKIVG